MSKQRNKLAIFEENEVRRTWHNDQWYFSVSDVVKILTESSDVKQYVKKMRARDEDLSVSSGVQFVPHLRQFQKKTKGTSVVNNLFTTEIDEC